MRLEPASDGTNPSPNVIGGSADNSVTPGVYAGTIGGGGAPRPTRRAPRNRVTDRGARSRGGANNQAGDNAGGTGDALGPPWAEASATTPPSSDATVAGGFLNSATAAAATVGGGQANVATGDWSTVPGGTANVAAGDFSFAAGTDAQASHEGSFVLADSNFFPSPRPPRTSSASARPAARARLRDRRFGEPRLGRRIPAGTTALGALVNGQPLDLRVNNARGLRIDPASDGTNQSPNVIGGIADNTVTPGVYAATIAGGGRSTPAVPATANRVTDNCGSIGGGANNQAGDGAGTADDRPLATVGGGRINFATGDRARRSPAAPSTRPARRLATVAGGVANTATRARESSTVGGGATANDGERPVRAPIGGGANNTASGTDATVPGGSSNSRRDDYTPRRRPAGERRALRLVRVGRHDQSPTSSRRPRTSSASAQPAAPASSPVVDGSRRTRTPASRSPLARARGHRSPTATRSARSSGSRPNSVLRKLARVPISTWSYRAQDDSIRHIGPMAQDFYRAFGVGESRRRIDSVDADGVALAAIQGLARKLAVEHARRLAQEQRLDRLEARVAALEGAEGGG